MKIRSAPRGLLLVAYIGSLCGCSLLGFSTGSSPVVAHEPISPEVALNDSVNYKVESLWIGLASSKSTYVYGIAKISYLGAVDQAFVSVSADFLNSSGGIL
jgi:hypothetical protein